MPRNNTPTINGCLHFCGSLNIVNCCYYTTQNFSMGFNMAIFFVDRARIDNKFIGRIGRVRAAVNYNESRLMSD